MTNNQIGEQIQGRFDCHVSFDLEDCDKMLRVECRLEAIDISELINLLEASGIRAEIL